MSAGMRENSIPMGSRTNQNQLLRLPIRSSFPHNRSKPCQDNLSRKLWLLQKLAIVLLFHFSTFPQGAEPFLLLLKNIFVCLCVSKTI